MGAGVEFSEYSEFSGGLRGFGLCGRSVLRPYWRAVGAGLCFYFIPAIWRMVAGMSVLLLRARKR